MQHTAEEMFHWSVNDVLTNVRLALPYDWTLDVQHDDTTKVFSCTVKDSEGREQWAEEHSDLRLLLFDFYGWLNIRQAPSPSPMWNRPREAPPRIARDPHVYPAQTVPDPGDLDPDEIRSMYERKR